MPSLSIQETEHSKYYQLDKHSGLDGGETAAPPTLRCGRDGSEPVGSFKKVPRSRENVSFEWDLGRLAKRSYIPWYETEEEIADFFRLAPRYFGLKRGPRSIPVLLQEYIDRYVFVAEDGIYVTDNLDACRIALVAEDYWKAQEILLQGGTSRYEGKYRMCHESGRYDKTAENEILPEDDPVILEELRKERELEEQARGGTAPRDTWLTSEGRVGSEGSCSF
ncbi:hypothetical protein BJ508DRAFT_340619 [Ascobolus immersus RN42]|uniref:Uncharacterized protein n=1 Tax=Ascobolus immersus RN42 TaxID=1160509 RepID=A0A3N4HJJ9_ASCIM|nr:hypothetical protein BJ508DRAFT_340619 [Ascobolus immersus RN42]